MAMTLPDPAQDPPTNDAPPLQVRVRELVPIFVWTVALLFFFYFIGPFKLVLLSFLAALCLSALLRPMLRWLPGPRALKGFLVGLLPIFVCAGLLFISGWLLFPPFQNQLRQWPHVEERFNGWLATVSTHLGFYEPLTVQAMLARIGGFLGTAGLLKGFGGNAIDIAIGTVLVFIGTIYMLAEPAERAVPAVLELFPPRRKRQAQAFVRKLQPRLRWWLIGALTTAVIIGATSLLGFWVIGLELFIPLGILAGLSEFVPTIGPALAFLVALAFAATQGVDKVVWLCGLYVLVHILESYILIPIIFKEAVRIPPVITLFTVVLWGEIFGIGGLLLALPINLFLWTLAEEFLGRKNE